MSRPICAVTGPTGFVGQAVVRRFRALGWKVVTLMRRLELASEGYEARPFTLGKPVAMDVLADVDVLVHAAYDFSLCSWSDICHVNVVGSEYLFDAATRAGVTRQIFISSMAAFEGCQSYYGLGKLVTEHAVQIRGGSVIRPGMIYSEQNGGLAARIIALARKFPLVPMIGSGRFPFYTCHVDDLCELIVHIAQMDEPPRNIISAANPSPVTLRDLAKSARADKASSPIFPIPWRLVAAGLWSLENLGLRPGFRSDSIVSLVHANRAPDFKAIQDIPVIFRPFAHVPQGDR